MEITVSGRHTYVPEAFRVTCEEKLSKVELVAPKTKSISVEVSHENNPKLAELRLKVEITVVSEGPVVRAEAAAADAVTALDLAVEKLMERLRRLRDRLKNHHHQNVQKTEAQKTQFDAKKLEDELHKEAQEKKKSLRGEEIQSDKIYADSSILNEKLAVGESVEAYLDSSSPIVVRKKVHSNERLSIAAAIDHMELLGHDFYAFINEATDRFAVVYRRHGWSFGVVEFD